MAAVDADDKGKRKTGGPAWQKEAALEDPVKGFENMEDMSKIATAFVQADVTLRAQQFSKKIGVTNSDSVPMNPSAYVLKDRYMNLIEKNRKNKHNVVTHQGRSLADVILHFITHESYPTRTQRFTILAAYRRPTDDVYKTTGYAADVGDIKKEYFAFDLLELFKCSFLTDNSNVNSLFELLRFMARDSDLTELFRLISPTFLLTIRFSSQPIRAAVIIGNAYRTYSTFSELLPNRELLQGFADECDSIAYRLVGELGASRTIFDNLNRPPDVVANGRESCMTLLLKHRNVHILSHHALRSFCDFLFLGTYNDLNVSKSTGESYFRELIGHCSSTLWVLQCPMLCWTVNMGYFFIFMFAYLYYLTHIPKKFESFQNWPLQEWVLASFTVGLVLKEIQEISRRVQRRGNIPEALYNHFTDPWSVLDCVSVGILLSFYGYRYAIFAMEKNPSDSELRVAFKILSFNALFIWGRLLKFLNLSAGVGPLIQIFLLFIKDLVHFFFLFVFVLLAFAGSFHFLFKETIPSYESMPKSIVKLGLVFLGEVDSDEVTAISPYLGSLLMAAYLIIVVVMLLNLLIAILSNTFIQHSQSADKQYAYIRASATYELLWNFDMPLLSPPPFNILSTAVYYAFLFPFFGFVDRGNLLHKEPITHWQTAVSYVRNFQNGWYHIRDFLLQLIQFASVNCIILAVLMPTYYVYASIYACSVVWKRLRHDSTKPKPYPWVSYIHINYPKGHLAQNYFFWTIEFPFLYVFETLKLFTVILVRVFQSFFEYVFFFSNHNLRKQAEIAYYRLRFNATLESLKDKTHMDEHPSDSAVQLLLEKHLGIHIGYWSALPYDYVAEDLSSGTTKRSRRSKNDGASSHGGSDARSKSGMSKMSASLSKSQAKLSAKSSHLDLRFDHLESKFSVKTQRAKFKKERKNLDAVEKLIAEQDVIKTFRASSEKNEANLLWPVIVEEEMRTVMEEKSLDAEVAELVAAFSNTEHREKHIFFEDLMMWANAGRPLAIEDVDMDANTRCAVLAQLSLDTGETGDDENRVISQIKVTRKELKSQLDESGQHSKRVNNFIKDRQATFRQLTSDIQSTCYTLDPENATVVESTNENRAQYDMLQKEVVDMKIDEEKKLQTVVTRMECGLKEVRVNQQGALKKIWGSDPWFKLTPQIGEVNKKNNFKSMQTCAEKVASQVLKYVEGLVASFTDLNREITKEDGARSMEEDPPINMENTKSYLTKLKERFTNLCIVLRSELSGVAQATHQVSETLEAQESFVNCDRGRIKEVTRALRGSIEKIASVFQRLVGELTRQMTELRQTIFTELTPQEKGKRDGNVGNRFPMVAQYITEAKNDTMAIFKRVKQDYARFADLASKAGKTLDKGYSASTNGAGTLFQNAANFAKDLENLMKSAQKKNAEYDQKVKELKNMETKATGLDNQLKAAQKGIKDLEAKLKKSQGETETAKKEIQNLKGQLANG